VINGTVFVARTVGPIALAYWMRDAEASTSSDASAQCYGVPEDIRVFAMVVAKLKLIQIQREIFLTDVMVGADNATLQERPERFAIVGMHLPAHVLMRFVIDMLMRERLMQLLVARSLICRDQRNLVRHRVADEPREGFCGSILDDFTDDVTLAGDRADDRGLARRATPQLFLVPVAVAVQAADVGFVYLHDTHQLLKLVVLHPGAQSHAHIPSRLVRAGTYLAMDLQSAHTFLAVEHLPENFKPRLQWVVRILENRSDQNGEAIRMLRAGALAALPCKRASLGVVDAITAAAGAMHDAIRPAAPHQVLFAVIVGWEFRHQLSERHHE
jgi:hypothetical protein